MRIAVKNFATQMENKLQKHDDDYGEEGWLRSNCPVSRLIEKLTHERLEAIDAFRDCRPHELMDECVDVANMAMMIYDRLHHCHVERLKRKTGVK